MAITYLAPVTTPSQSGFRVRHIILSQVDERAEIKIDILDPNGEVLSRESIHIGTQVDVNAGRAEFTLAQFLALAPPGTATLHTEIEQALVSAGRFPAGTPA